MTVKQTPPVKQAQPVTRTLSWRGGFVLLACIGLAAAGCSSSSSSKTPSGGSSHSSSSAAKPSGTADVAYASSIEFLNEKSFGPAFAQATGFKYSGRAGASGELSADILSG